MNEAAEIERTRISGGISWVSTRYILSIVKNEQLTRDGKADPVLWDQFLRQKREQENIHFPCSADHEEDWQPYPVDLYSAIYYDHTHIHSQSPILKPCNLCKTK